MTETDRPSPAPRGTAFTGLKAHAESTLFRDWRVTPELKARLDQRIRARERKPTRPWLVQVGAAIGAICFLVIGGRLAANLALPGQEAPRATATADAGTTPAHSPAADTLPPLTPPAQAGPSDALLLTDRQVAVVTSTATFGVTVADAGGSAVTFTNAETAANGAAVQNQNGTALAATGGGIPGVEARPGQKIVLNADYSLEVGDANQTMSSLQQMATNAGGYVVEATLVKGNDDSYIGRLVLRVPAASYPGAVDRVRQAGRVTQERQWTQDVTDRYADTQARIALLQEMQGKLEELALKAATFDDWLKLARQLNETRAQIEQLQGSLKQLDNQIAYSTITLALHQAAPGAVEQPPAPAPEKPSLGRQVGQSFIHSLGMLGHLGTGTLVGLAAAVPFMLPLLVVLVLILWWLRRRRKE